MWPFDAKFNAANDAVTQAEAAQRAAQQRLDQAGLRRRRQARTELATATESVVDAREVLAAARETAREPNSQRAVARDQIEAARGALSNHDRYAKWQYLPENLSAAAAHIDALDTWHDWATGKPVRQDRLVEAVTTLQEVATNRPDDGTRQLAEVVHRWAGQRAVQLHPPSVQQHRSMGTGIEIDL